MCCPCDGLRPSAEASALTSARQLRAETGEPTMTTSRALFTIATTNDDEDDA